jgi:hypothetical protein
MICEFEKPVGLEKLAPNIYILVLERISGTWAPYLVVRGSLNLASIKSEPPVAGQTIALLFLNLLSCKVLIYLVRIFNYSNKYSTLYCTYSTYLNYIQFLDNLLFRA